MDSPVEEIKNRLDIVEVVRDYVTLEKAGSNFRAPCPFHFEKTPSFFVNQPRQMWRCFGGCNEGGDMFSFVMKIEGVEFPDALRILAKKAGVELKRENKEQQTKKRRLFDICEISTLFFERQLNHSRKGEEAKKYLSDRSINEESIKLWRIGYSPTSKSSLSNYLIGEGFQKLEIVEAGIAVGKGSLLFDRFRGRLMFPIFNLSGLPVGFGGRVIHAGDERAKYINSPATPLYDKSAISYGLSHSKTEIRRRGFVVVVEGYTDVILAHQAGHQYVISSSGTALTEGQVEIVKRYTDKMLTAFDMDDAGSSATRKGVDIAIGKGFDVRVIRMARGKDPADIISENEEEWNKCVEGAVPIIDFYFQGAAEKYNLRDPRQKEAAAEELLVEVKKISNDISKAHYVSQLAVLLSVGEDSVWEKMKKMKDVSTSEKTTKPSNKEKENKTRKLLLEEVVASLVVRNKNLLDCLEEEDILFFSDKIKNILTVIKEEKKELTEEERDLLNYFTLKPLNINNEQDCKDEVKGCLREIKKEGIRNKLKDIELQIREAERDQDEKEEEELVNQFRDYSKKLQQL